MSLFRVRDLWSFEFEQLLSTFSSLTAVDSSNISGSETGYIEEQFKSSTPEFIFSVGTFESIGQHDVFVCANLAGFICILQTPKNIQEEHVVTDEEKDGEQVSNELLDRQLLAVQKLAHPIVDLKCGYFNSAIKQSIAVLHFDKLTIYHVKRHQVDLVSPVNEQQELFSHEFEEHCKFDLIEAELAVGLLVLDNHSSRNPTKHNVKAHSDLKSDISNSKKLIKSDGKHHNWIQLPQRDSLLIQYSNQFVLTMVENKKLIGHFRLILDDDKVTRNIEGDNQDEKIEEIDYLASKPFIVDSLGQFVGSMPICHLHELSGSTSLIISTSDNLIYSIPTAKMITEAKQNVMKRVTLNLLKQSEEHAPTKLSSFQQWPDSTEREAHPFTIKINLNKAKNWSFELACLPIKMASLYSDRKSALNQSQILVMSRYQLDMFSEAGQHVWSQRYEVPLICMYPYQIIGKDSATSRTMTIICSDSVGGGRSQLNLLEGERVVWSALLNCKPVQIVRANLSKIKGALIIIEPYQLSASYLGTSSPSNEQDSIEQEPQDSFENLEMIDRPLFESEDDKNVQVEKGNEFLFNQEQLKVDIKLEASNQWPSIIVEASVKIANETNSVLRNVSLCIEHDELIGMNLITNNDWPIDRLNQGATHINLGHLWPDRREPIKIICAFSTLKTPELTAQQTLIDQQHLEDLSSSSNRKLLPKTLVVLLHFRYTESRSNAEFQCLMQEERVLLPLNLLAKLNHIDYSPAGSSQELTDVQANLAPNYRPPYYQCDIILRTNHRDFMDLLEEFVEGDLLCRGTNSELSISKQQQVDIGTIERRRQSTLENISLLAQSLDCRLKFFKNFQPGTINKQSSEDQAVSVMLSVAMKFAAGSFENLINLVKTDNLTSSAKNIGLDDGELDDVVWIHFGDLNSKDSSLIPEQSLKRSLQNWHICEEEEEEEEEEDIRQSLDQNSNCFSIISIEGKNPLIVLFVQSHLKDRCFGMPIDRKLKPLTEPLHDAIEINFMDPSIGSVLAIHRNLNSFLIDLLNLFEKSFLNQTRILKRDLDIEYKKLLVTTMSLLSMSKKLSNLPEEMQQQYSSLMMLNRQYQLRLSKILTDLEMMEKLKCEFEKVNLLEQLDYITIDRKKFLRFQLRNIGELLN